MPNNDDDDRDDRTQTEAPDNVVSLNQAKRQLAKSNRWRRELIKGKDKLPKPLLHNALVVLENHSAWAGKVRFDDLTKCIRVTGPLPRAQFDEGGLDEVPGEAWTESMTRRTSFWLSSGEWFECSKSMVFDAIEQIASKNKYHPVLDYLVRLQWDGVPRIDTWLTDHFLVEDSALTRAFGAKWLISACARAHIPGCKADYVLILEGGQRIGKSSMIRALCPNEEWFLETKIDLGHKDAQQIIATKWLVELSELSSLSKSDNETVKAFLTNQKDTFRPPYGRCPINAPRGCVFVGTVNPNAGGYLKDPTGGGRYWPVTSRLDQLNAGSIKKLAAVRDQLWAEAWVRYALGDEIKGERWWLTDADVIEAARAAQSDRFETDVWEPQIEEFLLTRQEKGAKVTDILAHLGVETAKSSKRESARVSEILTRLGWARVRVRRNGVRFYTFLPSKRH